MEDDSVEIISYKESKDQKPSSTEHLLESLDGLLKQADAFNSFLIAKKRKHMRSESEPMSSPKRKRPKGKKSEDDEEENSTTEIGSYLMRQPGILKGGNLKDYQLDALNWMISLKEANLNGILADDMGLGKTIQSIAFLAYMLESKKIRGPSLIVAPLTTLRNWERELGTWLPALKTVVLFATEKQRNKTYQEHIKFNNFDVIVTSYQAVMTCFNWMKKIAWRTLIIDEAHRIKNDETQISMALRFYQAEFKLLMTGTPLSNDLHELWSLLNFILPEIFSDHRIFDNIFRTVEDLKGQSKQKIQVDIAEKIHRVLGPFMKRRTKKEVETSLPPKTEMTLYISLTPLQVEMYRNYARYQNPIGHNIWERYKNPQVQLRKICAHPYMFEGVEPDYLPDPGLKLIEVSGKLVVLDKLLNKLLNEEGEHKILIFSQFTMMLDILEDYCTFRQYKICRIDGSMNLEERQRHILRFRTQRDHRIFLISTKAGGLGINLVEADIVIVYDMDWNPQNDLQAIDRAYRIGQKRPVQVYKFICEYTVEERMSEVQKIKLVWDDLVIQKGAIFMKNQPSFNATQANRLAQLGIGDIFRIQGKVSDQDIDQIIRFGKEKDAKQLAQIRKKLEAKIAEQIGNRTHSQFNPFSLIEDQKHNNHVQEINDNENEDEDIKVYLRKRNEAKNHIPSSRLKNKATKEKITAPYWQMFSNRNELEECYTKRAEATEKYREEIQAKIKKLQENGFPKWTETEYDAFLDANQRYFKDQYKEIAKKISTKTSSEVEKYSKVFYDKASNINEMKKEHKKILLAQEKLVKQRRQEKALKWKRSNYNQGQSLIPHAHHSHRYLDLCIARFIINHEEDWEDAGELLKQLKDDVVLKASIDSSVYDEKILSKRIYKVLEWIEKEMEEEEMYNEIRNGEDKPDTKKINKQSKLKQDVDSTFTSTCNFFLNYDKKKIHSKDAEERAERNENSDKNGKDSKRKDAKDKNEVKQVSIPEKVKSDISDDDERKQNDPTEVGSVVEEERKLPEKKEKPKTKPKPRSKKKQSKNSEDTEQ